jgi:hypothetical protein
MPGEGIAMFHKASLQAVPSEHLPAAHALRGPLPGITHDLRLDDAGDAKPAWITLLTTEPGSSPSGSTTRAARRLQGA